MTYQEAVTSTYTCKSRGIKFIRECKKRYEDYDSSWSFSSILQAIKTRLNKEIGRDICPYASPNIYLTEEEYGLAMEILDSMFPKL